MTAIDDVRAQGFYHVMKADLKAGDEIEAGYTFNYSDRKAGTSSD